MVNSLSLILRRQLAPQLRQIRLERKLQINQVASHCELSAGQIDLIELGQAISLRKYLRLAGYYGKKIRMDLVD